MKNLIGIKLMRGSDVKISLSGFVDEAVIDSDALFRLFTHDGLITAADLVEISISKFSKQSLQYPNRLFLIVQILETTKLKGLDNQSTKYFQIKRKK